jgi:fatty acid desaturase
MGSNHYWRSVQRHKQRLREAIPLPELKALHRKRPLLHLAYAGRQFALVGACSYALWGQANPWIWIPLAILQGCTFFNMTVLLHEVVHDGVFRRPRPALERALGLAYAVTSGISASQFTRWHRDHHDGLGDAVADPKRHWLSPRRNARWYKLLYCTPILMPIYFRAAARESSGYPERMRRTIRRERLSTVAIQLSAAALLWGFGGAGAMLRIWLVPYFFVFPVAFTLNRLGQHYDVDPTHPLKWSTLMAPSRFWEFLFLHSSYHLEHHYFPRVPFYNLRRLHRKLLPLYAELGLKPRTYAGIVWKWFVLNRPPHTNWDLEGRPTEPAAAAAPS